MTAAVERWAAARTQLCHKRRTRRTHSVTRTHGCHCSHKGMTHGIRLQLSTHSYIRRRRNLTVRGSVTDSLAQYRDVITFSEEMLSLSVMAVITVSEKMSSLSVMAVITVSEKMLSLSVTAVIPWRTASDEVKRCWVVRCRSNFNIDTNR